MHNSQRYKAPWSTSLIAISSAATVLCFGIALGVVWKGRGLVPYLALVPLAVVIASAAFTIRGYSVTVDAILVQRLFWTTSLPRAGLKSAQFNPNAMAGSFRTFGNGGMFSFTGFFYNKLLGFYRAFVTDPRRSVVLHYSKRTVVVSPASPEEFVRELLASNET
jgi:hypothetical protein